MALSTQDELAVQIEQANFVMLSLYREYSKRLLQNRYNIYYEKQMQRIRHDMMYLDKAQMVVKVRQVYVPLLKEFIEKQ